MAADSLAAIASAETAIGGPTATPRRLVDVSLSDNTRRCTRIVLSLSDEASAEIASKLCGQVLKIKGLLHHQRNIQAELHQPDVRPGRRGPWQRRREQEFQGAARGAVSAARLRLARELSGDLSPVRRRAVAPAEARVPQAALSPRNAPVMTSAARGEAMRGDGLELLIPFLPGLEAALEDPDVSEIMISGPRNVWVEGHGKLSPYPAPDLTEVTLERAAIHIARPSGLDPATSPILDPRLDDGSRVAICVPPASPNVAITVRRFGKRAYSAAQLVEQDALPDNVLHQATRLLRTRRNILVSGGTGRRKTTLLNALINLLPDDGRIVAIEDTLEVASTARTASGWRRAACSRGA